WLGLTVGCARCHDHKFDPIRARDFYSLMAFFNNVDEIGTGGPRDGRGNVKPYQKLPAPELEKQLEEATARVKAAREELKEVEDRLPKDATPNSPEWEILKLAEMNSKAGVTLTAEDDGSILSTGAHPDKDIYTLTVQPETRDITGFRLELIPDHRFPKGG